MQPILSQPTYPLPQPKPLRLVARILSYIFHPLFIPVFLAAYIIYVHPYLFASLTEKQKAIRLISIFIITAFFPAVTVFLLWRLKFANSIFLRTQKERIIPYVTSIIYFFWAFYVNKNLPVNPPELSFFFLGLFVSTSIALILNNYFKISMHGLGAGGAVAYIICLALVSAHPLGTLVAMVTILGGLVCTSRLIISDHHPMEIYWGVFIGAICQVMACYIMM